MCTQNIQCLGSLQQTSALFIIFVSLFTKFGVSANVVFCILNSCSCLYYYDILSYLHKYIYLCCMYNWQLFDCFKFESCIPYFHKKNITCAKHTFTSVHCGLAFPSCSLWQKTCFSLLFIVAKDLLFTVKTYLM